MLCEQRDKCVVRACVRACGFNQYRGAPPPACAESGTGGVAANTGFVVVAVVVD